jgi:hypothetical protein
MQPKARTEALIIEALPDETLVYDERTDKAHCLNATAALVWRLADGKNTVEEIAFRVSAQLGISDANELVWATLEQLDRAKLLIDAPVRSPQGRISRRELGRRMAYAGAAFVVIPAVLTVGAPSAASAASCLPFGGCCTTKSQCCGALNCIGPFTCPPSDKRCA